jgi:hypothetical protein
MKLEKATIKKGPMGLIKIKTVNGCILVNSNGIFSVTGEKSGTGKAESLISNL